MNKIDQFKALFPLKGQVTPEIINRGSFDVWDSQECIGALTLKAALVKHSDIASNIAWGHLTGGVLVDDQVIRVTTVEKVPMMDVTEPQEVTFILWDGSHDVFK